MSKICLIGAGSTIFAKRLLGDILQTPGLQESEIVLHDIDTERLKTSAIVTKRIIESLGLATSIFASQDRKKALQGVDYVILMMQVGGYKPSTVIDFEIPKKYGLRQTIADTVGVGGIMRALRTVPVIKAILNDMEDVCPKATLLNYVNPMAMLCMAINRLCRKLESLRYQSVAVLFRVGHNFVPDVT